MVDKPLMKCSKSLSLYFILQRSNFMKSMAKKFISLVFVAALGAATLQLRSTVFADDPTITVTNIAPTRLTVRIDKGPYTGKPYAQYEYEATLCDPTLSQAALDVKVENPGYVETTQGLTRNKRGSEWLQARWLTNARNGLQAELTFQFSAPVHENPATYAKLA
ncbi:MAG: hypothetical protein LBJ95_04290 [Oscillospiraceae bacterium]|jgi:hypothetical protein|nr:hypothetical protein [Oscillospiraceae bacterium]